MSKEKHPEANTTRLIEGEIDVRDIFQAMLWGKAWIVGITIAAAIASVIYALSLSNVYRAEAIVIPASAGQEAQGRLGGIVSQLGGISGLSSIIGTPQWRDKTLVTMEILKSRAFFEKFSKKRDILPKLLAAKEWDPNTRELTLDNDVYDPTGGEWLIPPKFPNMEVPSLQESHEVFLSRLSVSQEKSTGLIRISIEHISPDVAKRWVEWLIEDLNEDARQLDITEAKNSIEFLKEEIQEMVLSDLRVGLFNLMQSQVEKIMFARVTPEYVFKVIDPPYTPEIKVKPKRAYICIIATIIGSLTGTLGVLIYYFAFKVREQEIQAIN